MNFFKRVDESKPGVGSVFFSYKRNDPHSEKKIELVYQKLSAHDIPLFRDKKDIRYGHNWRDTLEDALNDCVCGIALFTEASLHSEYIQSEVKMLLKMNKLIPIQIDGTPFRWGAENIQGPDLSNWNGEEEHDDWTKLVQELTQSVSRRVTNHAQFEPLPFSDTELDQIGDIQTIGNLQHQPDQVHAYFRDAPDLPLMAKIESGEFLFRAPNGNRILTRLERDFALSVTPITIRQWNRAASSGARNVYHIDVSPDDENRPVTHVNWTEAHAYVDWLNARSGLTVDHGYGLPSESILAYCFENSLSELPNDSVHRLDKIPDVASLEANSSGLKGLTGCVWQWVEDAFEDEADPNGRNGEPHLNPTTSLKTAIGGSWRTDHLSSQLLRNAFERDFSRRDIGFRVMRRIFQN